MTFSCGCVAWNHTHYDRFGDREPSGDWCRLDDDCGRSHKDDMLKLRVGKTHEAEVVHAGDLKPSPELVIVQTNAQKTSGSPSEREIVTPFTMEPDPQARGPG